MRNAENFIKKTQTKKNSSTLGDLAFSGITAINLVLVMIAIVFILAVWQGFVLSQLWAWYIVPHFHLQPLPIVVAWGISLMASCLQSTVKNELKMEYTAIITPLMCLIFGWLGTWFL